MFRITTVAALSFLASSIAYASGSMTGTTKDEMVPSSKKKKTSSSYGFKIENFVSYDKRVLKASKKAKGSKKKKDGPPRPPTNAPTGRPTKAPTSAPTNPGSIDVSNLGMTVAISRFQSTNRGK